MATIGSQHKEFQLYGETITEKDGCLVNSEGKLAGSAIGLIDAVKLSHQSVGLSLEECLRMASLYPARFIKQDHQRGRIKVGYQADLVHFNDDFNVLNTWISGSHQSNQKDT
jgi:N-acetylglucosamine-6-phosphate deacetylase